MATIVVAIALVVGAGAPDRRVASHDGRRRWPRPRGPKPPTWACQLEAGRPPVLEVGGADEQLIQVMTAAGAVVAASPNMAGRPAVVRLAPGQSARVVTPLDDDEFVAVAEGAQTSDGPRIVLVARALVDVLDTTTVITRLLVIGLPLMVAVVALTTWFAVGRALAPVEAIRREVDAISAAQLHLRVPQPKADDEIGRLAVTMNRMLERLESATKQPAPLRVRRVARTSVTDHHHQAAR